jgi:hypothetical protein
MENVIEENVIEENVMEENVIITETKQETKEKKMSKQQQAKNVKEKLMLELEKQTLDDYKMPNITLLYGDCLERMKEIPNNSVNLILCDLPYGTTKCKWDTVIDIKLLWEQYKRIIVKPSGVILLFGQQPFTSMLISSNYDWYKYNLIWKKNKPMTRYLAIACLKTQVLKKNLG